MRLNYDDYSPITGNFTILREFDSTTKTYLMIDMETGYQTMSNWEQGSEVIEQFEEGAPDSVLETRFVDPKTKLVWYKSIVAMSGVMVYPENGLWKVAKYVKVPDGQEPPISKAYMQYQNGVYVLDEENAVEFDGNQYEDAMFEFYKTVNEEKQAALN